MGRIVGCGSPNPKSQFRPLESGSDGVKAQSEQPYPSVLLDEKAQFSAPQSDDGGSTLPATLDPLGATG